MASSSLHALCCLLLTSGVKRGRTWASRLSPQESDVAYGFGLMFDSCATRIDEGTNGLYLVPADGTLDPIKKQPIR